MAAASEAAVAAETLTEEVVRPEGVAAAAPAAARAARLPPIPRNTGFPGLTDLPERLRRGMEEPERAPRIRLYCFYGAADQFAAWAQCWVAEVPEWAESAVFEVRGHGLRESEPFDQSIEERAADAWQWLQPIAAQHARGGEAEGAPFALLGHSLGTQVMTVVAKRLFDELVLEPVAVFVLDRAPPHVRLLSDEGFKLVRDNAIKFFEIFDPNTGKLLKSSQGTDVGEKIMQKWRGGFMIGDQSIYPEGYHKFACSVTVFVCTEPFEKDKLFKKGPLPPEAKAFHSALSKLLQSAPDSVALWDERQFGMWRRWSHKGCGLVKLPTDHYAIKSHEEVRKLVWRELRRLC